MTTSNADRIQTWFTEVWNNRRADLIDHFASADWVGHGFDLPGDPSLTQLDKFKLAHNIYCAAFPDLTFTVEKTVTEGDLVSAYCVVRGTHTAEGLPFPPTGRPIEFSGVAMARLEDGKIVESWEGWNFLTMFQQLGRSLV